MITRDRADTLLVVKVRKVCFKEADACYYLFIKLRVAKGPYHWSFGKWPPIDLFISHLSQNNNRPHLSRRPLDKVTAPRPVFVANIIDGPFSMISLQ